jgi:hypothetical protein
MLGCEPGGTGGRAWFAVGMQRALAPAIGLPRRLSSASWMPVFLMPAEVSRNHLMPLRVILLSHSRTLKPRGDRATARISRDRRAGGPENFQSESSEVRLQY